MAEQQQQKPRQQKKPQPKTKDQDLRAQLESLEDKLQRVRNSFADVQTAGKELVVEFDAFVSDTGDLKKPEAKPLTRADLDQIALFMREAMELASHTLLIKCWVCYYVKCLDIWDKNDTYASWAGRNGMREPEKVARIGFVLHTLWQKFDRPKGKGLDVKGERNVTRFKPCPHRRMCPHWQQHSHGLRLRALLARTRWYRAHTLTPSLGHTHARPPWMPQLLSTACRRAGTRGLHDTRV